MPQGPSAYERLKWPVARCCAVLAIAIAVILLPFTRFGSAAFLIGAVCGLANVLGIMRGSERLVETHSAAIFGLSSLLRLTAFSIVAAAIAVRGPWWSLGPFLAGFFFPLAAYAWGAYRAFQREPERID